MTTGAAARQGPTCIRCGVTVECCGFCERVDCPEVICSRCLRIQLRESLPQPHVHGG
jgi:hypothetical protein